MAVGARRGPGRLRLIGGLVVLALAVAACGGDDDEPEQSTEEAVEGATGAVVDKSEQGEPVEGGSITFGLEAETTNLLPSVGQFANSGVSVAYALYDPLMKRDVNGEMKPYLAESMDPTRTSRCGR